MSKIPVLRPLLPDADQLLPYLKRIDETRFYSNFGPLSEEFHLKLAGYFQVDTENIECANSGTSALVAAILARVGRASKKKPLAIVPSFTFVATALAAELCGYDIVFSDVSAETWALEPDQVALNFDLSRVGIVIPVSPFGRPVLQQPWIEFQETTDVPVVIDGAACFDTIQSTPEKYLGPIPVTLSFHATKSFSTGEGGCIIADDPKLVSRATQSLNFGFVDSRECSYPSMNGKISEYQAAVGLAEFDHWSKKCCQLGRVSMLYREELSAFGLENKLVTAPAICSSYVLYVTDDKQEAMSVQNLLKSNGIGYRFWYGKSLQLHEHFSEDAPKHLPVAEDLSFRVFGLPVAPDLDRASISFICSVLGKPS